MMRKLNGLVVAMLLAGIVSSSAFAAAYSQASGTISLTPAAGDTVTVTTAAGQPDWAGIIPPPASEILRPTAAGDETGIAAQFPASGAHWDKVDETTSDDDVTYIQTSNTAWQEDLFGVADHAAGSGTINYVRVYMVVRSTAAPSQTAAYAHIKTNGVEYNGTAQSITTAYATYSYQWTVNPQTSAAWTWSEIDALQVGVGLRRPAAGVYARATQVYVEVNYSYVPTTGSVPTGNLFNVTPHAAYTGDLTVKVYMMNVEALAKAYHALSINLYLPGSAEAGDSPSYRSLTLDKGAATFNLSGSAGVTRTLGVNGGAYQLVSGQPAEWQAGYSLSPELVCEVTQR